MWYGAVGLLVTLILSPFTWAGAAEAQPATRVWRIGYLVPTELPRSTLIEPLRDLGYIDGQTARFEIRTAQNNLERLPSLAAELVRAQVDIIVAGGPAAIIAARQATSTIPIVMAFWGGEGLLESGVVASFARPGGNVTGVYMLAAELDAKRCELLLQAVPQARTVGVLNAANDHRGSGQAPHSGDIRVGRHGARRGAHGLWTGASRYPSARGPVRAQDSPRRAARRHAR